MTLLKLLALISVGPLYLIDIYGIILIYNLVDPVNPVKKISF